MTPRAINCSTKNAFVLWALALVLKAGTAAWAITVPTTYDWTWSVGQLLATPQGELPQGVMALVPPTGQQATTAQLPQGTSSLNLKGKGNFVPSDMLTRIDLGDPKFHPTSNSSPPAGPQPSMNQYPGYPPVPIKAVNPPTPSTVIDLGPLTAQLKDGIPVLELEAGQELTLSSLALYMVELPRTLGLPSTRSLDFLAPSLLFRVPEGATLHLSDVTLVLSEDENDQLLRYTCDSLLSLSYHPEVKIDIPSLVLTSWMSRAPDADGQGGHVHWHNVAIRALENVGKWPCLTVTSSPGDDVVGLTSIVRMVGPGLVYVTADVSITPKATPVEVPKGQIVVLIGNPDSNPTLDFSGAAHMWLFDDALPFPFQAVTQFALHDLVIINLPRPKTCKGPMSLLHISMHSFYMIRGAFSWSSITQVELVRCIIVLPDAELEFLSAVAQRNSSDTWPGQPSEAFELTLRDNTGAASTPGHLEVERMRLISEVLLLNCTLLSASSYAARPAAKPLLPQSLVWLPQLLEARDPETVARWGIGGLAAVSGLQQALEALTGSGHRQDYNPVQIIMGTVDKSIQSLGPRDAHMITICKDIKDSSPDGPFVTSCIVDSYPGELVGGRTLVDLWGAIGRFRTVRPVTLRNLVLYNLAPGGSYPLDAGGSPPPLEGPDAPWLYSALPLWFFHCDRSGAASGSSSPEEPHCVVLENVTLVVPEVEWRAFVAAVLLQHMPQAMSEAATRLAQQLQQEDEEAALRSQPPPQQSPQAPEGLLQGQAPLYGGTQAIIVPNFFITPGATGALPGDPFSGGSDDGGAKPGIQEGGDLPVLSEDPILSAPPPPPHLPSAPPSTPSLPSTPPPPPYPPSPPPSPPYMDTTQAALSLFAAASQVLEYNYRAGVLVLAAARHYGWKGTNVTITYKLPSDAPGEYDLLTYPELILPYAELAGLPIDIQVDFAPKTAPPSPVLDPIPSWATDLLPPPSFPMHTPSVHTLGAAPTSGNNSEAWQVPVAATVGALGGVMLLAVTVVVVMSVRARRAQRGRTRGLSLGVAFGGAPDGASLDPGGVKEPAQWPGASSTQGASCTDVAILCGTSTEGDHSVGIDTKLINGAAVGDDVSPQSSQLRRYGVQSSASAAASALTDASNTSEAIQSSLAQTLSRATAAGSGPQQSQIAHVCGLDGPGALAVVQDACVGKVPPIVDLDEDTFKREVLEYFRKLESGTCSDKAGGQNDGGNPNPPAPSGSSPPCSRRGHRTHRGVADAINALQAELRDPDLHVDTVVGQGAYGVVYRGTWRGLPVAVKTMVVSEAAAGREGPARHRAVLEAAISMSLAAHPNVVASYSYDLKPLVHELPTAQLAAAAAALDDAPGVEHGTSADHRATLGHDVFKLYIIQEYCNGGSMRHALELGMAGSVRSGGLPRLLALQLALDVALGMRHIHDSRIVHGDLKPDNVLLAMDSDHSRGSSLPQRQPGGGASFLDARGLPRLVAKVADFGLSLPLEEGATHVSHRFQGTPMYTAPEVLSSGRVSPQSDVWSFGLMLLELYYGRPLSDLYTMQAAMLAAAGRAATLSALVGALLREMMGSSELVYAELAAACLLLEPRARPGFPTLASKLQALAGSS